MAETSTSYFPRLLRYNFQALISGRGFGLADQQFVLFPRKEKGHLRGIYARLETARVKAQELADQEGIEYVVCTLDGFTEVAHFFPRTKGAFPPGRDPKRAG
jgi:hypothetical protein